MKPLTALEFAKALERGDYPDLPAQQLLGDAVHVIADELATAGRPVPPEGIRNAMNVLRSHRHFDHMHEIGMAWHDTRGCDAVIQRLLVQAMVELGSLDHADLLLDEAARAADVGPADLAFTAGAADYQALRGRIRKQRFVLTRDVNVLAESVRFYEDRRQDAPGFFLAVNVLALRTRLHRFGIPQSVDELTGLARDVLKRATDAARDDPDNPWSLATASEACLALHHFRPGEDWCDRAELWLFRFLGHPESGSFEVQSYFRQLREIWDGNPLDASTCPGRLAKILERHVLRTERRWSVDARQLQRMQDHPEELEKNFSGEKAFTVDDIRKMLALTPNIGCVKNDKDVRMGTGFLVPASVFGGHDEGLLFVTNAHVISETVPNAIGRASARVVFEVEAGGATPPCLVDEVLFSSEPGRLGNVSDAPGKLDVTVCRLSRTPNDAKGLPVGSAIPWPSPRAKAFVVGHPQAGELQFSLQDSVLLDVCPNERLMHYRTPTDPGSSGSPVFNKAWEVVALHHAGSQACPRLSGVGLYEANEGITLQSIRNGWNGARAVQ